MVSQIETILLAPNKIQMQLLTLDLETIEIGAQFNLQVKCIHLFTIIFIIIAFFIFIFVFPKRISNMQFMKYVLYASYLFALAVIVYSLICDDYVLYFNVLLLKTDAPLGIKELTPVSFFGNSNLLGMFFELYIFISLLTYSLTKKTFNLVLAVFFYIYLILTLCKAGILFASIAIILYCITRIYYDHKDKLKKQLILHIIMLSIIVLLILAIGTIVLIFSEQSSKLFSGFSVRVDLWYSSIQIIKKTSIVRGTGYGIYDSLIANVSGYYRMTNSSITHNWILSILGKGGLIMLIPFSGIIVYSVLKLKKTFMFDKKICLVLVFGELSFFLHSFFEDNYFILFGIIVMVLIFNNILYKQDKNEELVH